MESLTTSQFAVFVYVDSYNLCHFIKVLFVFIIKG